MTLGFLRSVGERAIATFAQTLMAILVGDGLTPTSVMTVGWRNAALMAAGAAMLCVLKCLAASRIGDSESPSAIAGGK